MKLCVFLSCPSHVLRLYPVLFFLVLTHPSKNCTHKKGLLYLSTPPPHTHLPPLPSFPPPFNFNCYPILIPVFELFLSFTLLFSLLLFALEFEAFLRLHHHAFAHTPYFDGKKHSSSVFHTPSSSHPSRTPLVTYTAAHNPTPTTTKQE